MDAFPISLIESECTMPAPERLILRSNQSPGDIVMLTAALRDLHAAYPRRFITDVRTPAPALWENNPWVTPLGDHERALDMRYPLIHESNARPVHFVQGYAHYLEQQLGLRIPTTRFGGDIHLSGREKAEPPHPRIAEGQRYWVLIAGGKYDFTAKWWDPAAYQEVVDRLAGTVHFVQCGHASHWHPRLRGVTRLVGETTIRQFVRLMYWADGVVCPVTFAMHLAAAVPTSPGRPTNRPAVVIAGGREPTNWEAYPHHRYLSTVGALPCCQSGGCWKSQCLPTEAGGSRCARPVQVGEQLVIPECMQMIRAEEVARQVLSYYDGGVVQRPAKPPSRPTASRNEVNGSNAVRAKAATAECRRVLLRFPHGLGDTVQLGVVLKHLRRVHPSWRIDVSAIPGRHQAVASLCEHAFPLRDARRRNRVSAYAEYDIVHDLKWCEATGDFQNTPSTKPAQCLRDVFGIEPDETLFRYEIAVDEEAMRWAKRYCRRISRCEMANDGRFPIAVFHYQGDTSREKKELPEELVAELCRMAGRRRLMPVILDANGLSGLVDQRTVFSPASDPDFHSRSGGVLRLAALLGCSRCMIGIDSGPLHVAGATSTPTLGVWTEHHPVRYFDLADNVTHLVPEKHGRIAPGPKALRYFAANYRHDTYAALPSDLPRRFEAFVEHAMESTGKSRNGCG